MRSASRLLLATALTGLPLAALAQSDDRSWLTAFLEDNLSGAGRQVTITGFTGALSSRATMEKMTIADDQGIWLTLDNVVLDWSRTALLSGEVIVNELTAAQITVARIPAGEEDSTAPEAGTFDFTLPDLPVSIDIGKLAAEKIVLGESVLGQALEASLSAEIHLNDGEGTAKLLLERNDAGPEARISLDASYSNATRQLVLDLTAAEGAGGLVASALDLPGRPAADLHLKGQGTFDDFAADFRLASDGAERLAGPITVKTDEAGTRAFSAALAGNPAPLFLPEYAGFLGDALSLDVAGRAWASGRLNLDRLALDSQTLKLAGSLELAADGLPAMIDLTASLAAADGTPVLLPISGPVETRVDRADVRIGFDARNDSGWTARIAMLGLDRSDLTLERATLNGSGRIDRVASRRGVGGTLNFDISGLGALDPALIQALGTDFTGRTIFRWREGNGALSLSDISLSGAGLQLAGGLKIEGLGEALTTSGRATLTAADLSRFSAIAGSPLGGAGTVTLSGSASALTGAFDLDLDLAARGLSSGIPEADRLLAGNSAITASVLRDETGTHLRSFTAAAASLNLSASGSLASAGSDLSGRIDWRNLADLGGNYGGALSADIGFTGTPENGTVRLDGQGNSLRIGQAEVDRLLAGQGDLSAELALKEGLARLVSLSLTAPNISATVAGEGDAGAMRVSGRIRDLALVAPQFPGALELSGRVTPEGNDYLADLRVTGPAGLDARLNGRVTGSPDVAISGSGDAGLVNGFTDPVTLSGPLRYDLRLSGGWTPAALSGRVTLSGGNIAVPARGLALERVSVAADIASGRTRLTTTAELPRGGRIRVDGSLGIIAPFDSALTLVLDRIRLRDPELYDTTVDANLSLQGPLLGQARLSGRAVLDQTELRVPSTGFASGADLEAFLHRGDSAQVRATRARAGVGASASGGDSGASSNLDWLLDLVISAPNRVFIRGRGLDAELGGEFRVGGSIANIIPSGGLELVRGRLDILGKRLTLSEATLRMEGDFVPYLSVSASNTTDDVTSTVSITGRADEPVVSFSSNPDMPQEEVLAWLLFGRGLDTISAFQAAQLANAVATLAGRGGEGIMGRLRQGFGFDDLDVSTAADGSTSVSAGKYISDNLYTEVGVGQNGQARINLNLDVRPGVTVKGRVDSDGSSGIGIFLERDY